MATVQRSVHPPPRYLALLAALWGCAAPRPPCPQPSAAAASQGSASASARQPVELVAPPAMVVVPAGKFLRGSPDEVGLEDEHPQREIVLDAFFLDRTEVSAGAYGECVAAGRCAPPKCGADGHEVEADADHPVVCVTWKQAQTYCEWAGKRLPTEAEWEKAARGIDGQRYPWGSGEPTCELANFADCGNRTRAVGSSSNGGSPYGALDMAGNVWEWVSDWHHAEYYAISPRENPPGPYSGTRKVVRGGAFSYGADSLESHGRTYDDPTVAYDHVGFRCAQDAAGPLTAAGR